MGKFGDFLDFYVLRYKQADIISLNDISLDFLQKPDKLIDIPEHFVSLLSHN